MWCGSQQRALDGLCTARVVGKDSRSKSGRVGQQFNFRRRKSKSIDGAGVERWTRKLRVHH